MRAHEFYFCHAVLVVDGSCLLFLGSLQFMFVVWEGMVVAVFMDSLKAKLNICLYLCQDFPGGLVVKTLPSNAGGAGSIPGQGAKTPPALEPKNQNRSSICNKFNKKNQTNKKTILQGILIINYKLQNSVNSPVPFLIQYQKTSLFTLGKKREIETLGVKVRDRDGQTFQKALRHRESMNVLKSFFYRSTSFFLVGFF